jgi:hypothetical protein
MVRIDDTLPWIELKRNYQTRKEAKQAAEDFLKSMQMKIVALPEKALSIKQITSAKSKREIRTNDR